MEIAILYNDIQGPTSVGPFALFRRCSRSLTLADESTGRRTNEIQALRLNVARGEEDERRIAAHGCAQVIFE